MTERHRVKVPFFMTHSNIQHSRRIGNIALTVHAIRKHGLTLPLENILNEYIHDKNTIYPI